MSDVTYYGAFIGGYEDGYLIDDDAARLIHRGGYSGGVGGGEGDDMADIIFNNEVGAFEVSTKKCGGSIELKEGDWRTIGFIVDKKKKKIDTSVYSGSREKASGFYARIGSHDAAGVDEVDEVDFGIDEIDRSEDDHVGVGDDYVNINDTTPSFIGSYEWDGLIDDHQTDDDQTDDDDWSQFVEESAVVDAVVPDEAIIVASSILL